MMFTIQISNVKTQVDFDDLFMSSLNPSARWKELGEPSFYNEAKTIMCRQEFISYLDQAQIEYKILARCECPAPGTQQAAIHEVLAKFNEQRADLVEAQKLISQRAAAALVFAHAETALAYDVEISNGVITTTARAPVKSIGIAEFTACHFTDQLKADIERIRGHKVRLISRAALLSQSQKEVEEQIEKLTGLLN